MLVRLLAPYLIAVGALAATLYAHGGSVFAWLTLAAAAGAALWPALRLARALLARVTRLTDFANAAATGAAPPILVPEGDDVVTRLESNVRRMAESLHAQLQAARGEKGKLAAVLSGMVEGVLVIDRGGTVRLANQRAARIFGAPSGDALAGQPLISLSRDPDLHALVRGAFRPDAERPLVREIILDRRRGETLQVTATAIAGTDGGAGQYILVFHDISEQQKLEATRRDFVANVSHELRTPLTAIRGYAETLQAGALHDPEMAAKFLGIIDRHSERLGRLIDDLLTLSDLELGRAALQRTAMRLETAVDAAIDVLHEKAARGGVHVRRALAADLPLLYADPDRLEQVLVNLLDNAVKYTPRDGHVTVGACVAARVTGAPPQPAPPAWVELSVADTGIGVPKADLPRLTERFYRVDKARSRELGGTGLGLAIVKHIVQAHGGLLRIESELGQGTCVRVYWPIAGGAPAA